MPDCAVVAESGGRGYRLAVLALALFVGLTLISLAIVGAGLRISRAITAFTDFLGALVTRQQERRGEHEFHD